MAAMAADVTLNPLERSSKRDHYTTGCMERRLAESDPVALPGSAPACSDSTDTMCSLPMVQSRRILCAGSSF